MTQTMRVLTALFTLSMTVAVAETAAGQTSKPAGQSSGGAGAPPSAAGTSVAGDTGLWAVPTAKTLPVKRWTISFARVNQQDGQGFTNVSNMPVAFAIGVASRVELFGSWTVISRLDRDTIPLFFDSAPSAASSGTGGGLTMDYPLDRKTWIKDATGDVRIGGKINLVPQTAAHPVALATRMTLKLPVGSESKGASTGKPDFQIDAILSRSLAKADITGFAGVLVRENPIGYTLSNGLRWGFGAGFPLGESHALTFATELYGEHYFHSTIAAPSEMVAPDGSIVPVLTTVNDPVYLGLSLTWHASNGFFLGVAGEWNMTVPGRDQAVPLGSTGGFPNSMSGKMGYEARIGYRLGGRSASPVAVARPASAKPAGGAATGAGAAGAGAAGAGGAGTGAAGAAGAAGTGAAGTGAAGAGAGAGAGAAGAGGAGTGAAAAAPPRANRPPTVRASCDPCTVEVGKTTTVNADAQDPDGDPLTYQWTAPSGTFGNARSRQTTWTAPLTPGPVRLTTSVDDGHGGLVTSGTTIEVVAAGATSLAFEEVHFDFDKSNLRPDAVKILDDMVAKLKANPSVKVEIEGHTCNIGTPEYNLALSQRRAQTVLNYLVAHGISADRLHTTGYGLERPKYDNTKFDQRKLNRRAEFVVRIQ
jgi:outer membrane protein OmpA-like peptidoglycan-associated protein